MERWKLPIIIPSVQNNEDLSLFLKDYDDEWAMLKVGDINSLPAIVKRYHQNGRKVIIHQDSIKGINADRSSIYFLEKIGADAVDTTKWHCIKTIKQCGMLALIGLFIIDSISVKSAIRVIGEGKPDYAVLMPSTVPKRLTDNISRATGVHLLGGGLCGNKKELNRAFQNGLEGIVTSAKALWHPKVKGGGR